MQKYKVPDMSCGHCVATIEKTIHALDPKAVIACDLDHKEVTVTSAIDSARIAGALAEASFESTLLAA
jgi:copper chaperone